MVLARTLTGNLPDVAHYIVNIPAQVKNADLKTGSDRIADK